MLENTVNAFNVLTEIFTDENIIEFMIDYYKDFKYVDKVLEMSFDDGFKLYLKCIERVKIEHEEKLKSKYWDLFLIAAQNGYDGNFEDYYKSKVSQAKTLTMTNIDKEHESDRIKKRVQEIDISNLKRR